MYIYLDINIIQAIEALTLNDFSCVCTRIFTVYRIMNIDIYVFYIQA